MSRLAEYVIYQGEKPLAVLVFEADTEFEKKHPRDKGGQFQRRGISPDGDWKWDEDDPQGREVGRTLAKLPQGLRDNFKKRGLKITAAPQELSYLPGMEGSRIDGAFYNQRSADSYADQVGREYIDTRLSEEAGRRKHEVQFITLHETGHAFDDMFADLTPKLHNPLDPKNPSSSDFMSGSEDWWGAIAGAGLDPDILADDHEFFADVFAKANGVERHDSLAVGIPVALTDWMKEKIDEAAAKNG